ncbi:PP2C family protein-serine/threonine phosphatase [Bryobacter aggregatus]|uniref:PP2C family protein-serine/threonine phosphatase n=1 Tax=Bryobacter aggregatus TaxID=360054 RepID=UPI00138DF5C7|nr:SpoIIE family protein phosphatase [Bryobacter aggregatus]
MTVREALSRVGWWERIFAVFFLVFVVGSLTGGLGDVGFALVLMGLIATAPVAILRISRLLLRSVIWRLSNRLIVSYIFIALVPLLLLLTLCGIATYLATGQMATYLINSELDRQIGTLRGAAESVLRVPAERRVASIERLGDYFTDRFPNFEIRLDQTDSYVYPEDASIQKPPAGTKDAAGILRKDNEYYIWAHVKSTDGEVTALAPLSGAYLSSLVPHLGAVSLRGSASEAEGRVRLRRQKRNRTAVGEVSIPTPVNAADIQLNWFTVVPVHVWEAPAQESDGILMLRTRFFAVVGVIFATQQEQNSLLNSLLFASSLFLLFEIVALVIGVKMTRTITVAVHDLYEGTNRVMEGDFSHRIPLTGRDQLAQLSDSFNRMTENLEKLLQVAKENERLNAELEIAREVQRQLYPKFVPESKEICLTAHYQPARMVSGDYFDFHRLSEHEICFSMGDVAGKGISAALLMATVQSSFRSRIQTSSADLNCAQTVTELNKQLYANTAPEKFSTFFLGIFDETSGKLRYTNAGHLPPILIRKGEATLLNVDGMVVGAFPFAKYGESEVALEPGDFLLLYTDGISEPQNDYGEMYGEDRLIELVKRNVHLSDQGIIEAVMAAVEQWTGSPDLQDDMTLLIARRP